MVFEVAENEKHLQFPPKAGESQPEERMITAT